MKEIFIYHIPGIKVGVTLNLKRRTGELLRKYGKDKTVELLEVCKTYKSADEREFYWADHFKYPRGTSYLKMRKMNKK